MKRGSIHVGVPVNETRRDRVERNVFDQLAAIKAADRADEIVAPVRRRAWMPWIAFACAAVATVAIVILVRGSQERTAVATGPSSVVTPVGGSSRFTVGDALVDAGSDTQVQFATAADGSVRLDLMRGSVDCDVAPIPGRAPFRVVADDIVVEVVGTRFTVSRSAAGVRVDVARGKVLVHAPSGDRFVIAGETWPNPITATVAPARASTGADEPTAPPVTEREAVAGAAEPAEPAKLTTPPPAAQYESAQRLERTDPAAAARAYRKLAEGRTKWAALAVSALAELQRTDPRAALATISEYERRFPNGANIEDMLWLKIEVLRGAGRADDARAAASAYVRRFPQGTYATPARRLASP